MARHSALALIAMIVALSAAAAADTLILKNGRQLRGTVFPLSGRYLIYTDGGLKAVVPKSRVARHIISEGTGPDVPANSPVAADLPVAVAASTAKLMRVHIEFRQGGAIQAVAISDDGARVATGSGDGTVKVWNAGSGRLLMTLKSKYTKSPVGAIQFVDHAATRCILAALGRDMVVWDARSGREIRWYGGHQRSIEAVAYRRADNVLISVCRGEMILRNFDTGKSLAKRSISLPGGAGVSKADIATDGVFIYTVHRDFRCRRWKSTSRMIEPEVIADQLPQSRIPPTALSARGAWVVAAAGSTVVAQQRNTRRNLLLTGHRATVRSLATTAQFPHMLLSADESGAIHLWAVDSQRDLANGRSPAKGLSGIAMAANATRFIVGHTSGVAHLWTIEK